MTEVMQVPQDYHDAIEANRGGFSFELCKRNMYLAEKASIKPPTAMKSGTTICGVCPTRVLTNESVSLLAELVSRALVR